MKAFEDFKKEIRQVKKEYQHELYEATGYDYKKFASIEKKYADQMKEIAIQISQQIGEKSQEVETRHTAIMKEYSTAHMQAERIEWPICTYYGMLWYADLCNTDIIASPSVDFNVDTAEVDCDKTKKAVYPFVELHSAGAGSSKDLTAKGWISFNFRPQYPGNFSFQPFLRMSGYYLFQIWGGGCTQTVESSADFKLKATINVEQAGATLTTREYTIYDHQSSDGFFEPIDKVYTPSTSCYIPIGNRDTTIEVGVKVETTLTGNGQVFVDLKRNPNFYFIVDYITVRQCWWPFIAGQVAAAATQRYQRI